MAKKKTVTLHNTKGMLAFSLFGYWIQLAWGKE